MRKVSVSLLITGLIVTIAAVYIGWFGAPNLIKGKIIEKLQLREESLIFQKWKNVSIPIFMSFYIFNVTNPDEFDGENDVKPVLQQVGPYVYEEKRWKDNITFHEDGTIVEYTEMIRYFYRPDMSTGSVDDIVNIFNMPFIAAITKTSKISVGTANTFSKALWGTGNRIIRQNVRVGDFLFDGIDVSDIVDCIITNSYGMASPPPDIADGKYAFKKIQNKTGNAVYKIYTGIDDPENFGKLYTWNDQTALNVYDENSSCNEIRGSDGSLYPPFLSREREYPIFNFELCRTLSIKYLQDSEFKGIPSYRFSISEDLFEDPKDFEKNRCYCKDPGNDFEKCTKKGVISLKECKDGTPVIMSKPHFLDADPEYINGSIGLKPDAEKHQAYLELQPDSAMVLHAKKRMQLNVELKALPRVLHFKKFKTRLLPVLWLDENIAIDDKTAEGVKAQLLRPKEIIFIGKWILLGVGIFITLLGLILLKIRRGGSSATISDVSIKKNIEEMKMGRRGENGEMKEKELR